MTTTKTDAEWRSQLSDIEYRVTREAATERPFTGQYWDHWNQGIYHCVGRHAAVRVGHQVRRRLRLAELFPPDQRRGDREHTDHSHGMTRVEVRCKECGSHLGHVFEDGPAPPDFAIASTRLR
jgi:peptide-methionine (R)-S-oxide reductase